MNEFQHTFIDALGRSANLADFVVIVQEFKARRLGQHVAYDELQMARLYMGCQTDDRANANCDTLEAVMDRVWGYFSRRKFIWPDSLTD